MKYDFILYSEYTLLNNKIVFYYYSVSASSASREEQYQSTDVHNLASYNLDIYNSTYINHLNIKGVQRILKRPINDNKTRKITTLEHKHLISQSRHRSECFWTCLTPKKARTHKLESLMLTWLIYLLNKVWKSEVAPTRNIFSSFKTKTRPWSDAAYYRVWSWFSLFDRSNMFPQLEQCDKVIGKNTVIPS